MKRLCFKLGMFIIAGAFITTGVAWWFAVNNTQSWKAASTIQYVTRGGFMGVDSETDVLVTAMVYSGIGDDKVVINAWQKDDARFHRPDLLAPTPPHRFGSSPVCRRATAM